MVFLGIVVAVIAVAAGAGVIAGSSSPASLDVFGRHVPGVHTGAQAFIAGVVVATLIVAGLTVSWLSLLRSMRVRRELGDLRDDREEAVAALMARNERLARELSHARGGSGGAPVPGPRPAPQQRDTEPASPFFDHSA